MTDIRILAISGSLRRESGNTALVRATAELAAPGVVVEPWGGLGAIPPFDEDVEDDTPAAVADLRAAIAGADAVLLATPEYNGSVPGQLKNAVDWASRPYGASVLQETTAAVVSASPSGYGATWAGEHLATVLGACGVSVLDRRFALPHSYAAFTDDARLVDAEHEAALRDLLGALVDVATARRSARAAA